MTQHKPRTLRRFEFNPVPESGDGGCVAIRLTPAISMRGRPDSSGAETAQSAGVNSNSRLRRAMRQ